jgi:hypothetical protein
VRRTPRRTAATAGSPLLPAARPNVSLLARPGSAAVAAGTEVGKKAKALMAAGALVGDDIVIGIIKDRIQVPTPSSCRPARLLGSPPAQRARRPLTSNQPMPPPLYICRPRRSRTAQLGSSSTDSRAPSSRRRR